jgi:hypothetical protein
MEQKRFESRFAYWQALPGEGDPAYHKEIWTNVGTSPLDTRLTDIVELYEEADSQQQHTIKNYFEKQYDRLWELTLYIRRVGKLIKSDKDSKWLHRGITAALIEGGRGDFRDLIVSLVILRYAAGRLGIDAIPYFDNAINLADSQELIDILKNARDHAQSDILFSVRTFGPKEWAKELGDDTREKYESYFQPK